MTLQKLVENRWRCLTFTLIILDDVSNRGSGAGIVASSHGGD